MIKDSRLLVIEFECQFLNSRMVSELVASILGQDNVMTSAIYHTARLIVGLLASRR